MTSQINNVRGPVAPSNLGEYANGNAAIVHLGENSLSEVADRVGVHVNDLVKANPQILDPGRLNPGQEIFLPSPLPSVPAEAAKPSPESAASGLSPNLHGDPLLKNMTMEKLSSNAPGYSAPGLKDAMANSRASGLPIFDDKALSVFFSSASKEAHNAALTELAVDPKTFVKTRFSLTDQLKKHVDNLSTGDIKVIRDAANLALSSHSLIAATCGHPINDQAEEISANIEHPNKTEPQVSFSKETASKSSVAAMKGYSGTVTIHMSGFSE